MANPFAITAASNSVQLGANRAGETTFTVFNASGRPIRGRARIVPSDPSAEEWMSVVGEVERDFEIAGAQQFVVHIEAPSTAKEGEMGFRLDMVDVENPDENYTQGPGVTFQVPAAATPFPWWIVAAAVGVIALIAVGVVVAGNIRNTAKIAQATQEALTMTQTAAAMVPAATDTAAPTETPMPTATDEPTPTDAPTATGMPTATDTDVPTATTVPTSTPTPTSTNTGVPTATPTPSVTPTPTVPLGSIIDHFVGTWVNVDENTSGMTKLIISKVNNSVVSFHGFGKCHPTDCDWGVVNTAFTPFRVVATQDAGFKTRIISVERSGSRLLAEVFDDYPPGDSRTDRTSNYTLERQRFIVVPRAPLDVDGLKEIQPERMITLSP